jgi:pimeloyl-ACP methyl ester carboxylesterase
MNRSKKPIKKRVLPTVVIILLLTAVVLIRTPDSNPDEMLNKYGNQHSGFIHGESGLKIHYRDQGKQDGRLVIFLHGSSGSLHVFEPLIEQLGEDYRFISYDHPGHGLTGPHPENNYSYAGYAQILDLVRSKLKADQFILVGHSMGGWIAWRYAVDHPEAVHALILISASGMPVRNDDPIPKLSLGQQLMQTGIGRRLSEYTMPRSMIERSTRAAIYDDGMVTDELVDQFWELMRYPGNRQAFSIRSQLGREPELADLAKSIQAPTLLIWGDKDAFVLPSAALSFSERIQQSETVLLPDVGHLPMLEAPAETKAAIEEFLDHGPGSSSRP